ncbi:GNAT family N-acetyltransferase, partial [Aphanothece microscopica]|uniref:GNAT family N-acetyltransferase n=1 Tax=Aphanothece microscopica TaxID=1049561 RepID=UPI0039846E38
AWKSEVSAQSREFSALARKRRKTEREIGPIRFVANDPSEAAWDTFVQWKDAALRKLGLDGFLTTAWTRALIEDLRRTDTPSFGGMFSTLYVGDRLVSAHFGLRTDRVLHWWFPTYDPAPELMSPGTMLLVDC